MAKKRSMTRNQNHDEDASSKKKVNTGDNGGVGPWSDLNHHLLYLVMMRLGVVDYLSFSCVCKSWRSLAISNRNTFMASKPPMTMRIPSLISHKKACYLEDSEGRKFKTILPPFSGGACLGLTCGYLIFLRWRKTTCDFWLVNPITRHQLYFTNCPIRDYLSKRHVRAILVFSVLMREWVFLVICSREDRIWYSISGTRKWDHVSCENSFADICACKGTIYTLNRNPHSHLFEHVYELRLYPEPKLTLLETKNSLKRSTNPQLVSSGENVYVMDRLPKNISYTWDDIPKYRYTFEQLDFDEMKWVSREKTLGEHASFLSDLKYGVAMKPRWYETRRSLLLGHGDGDVLKRVVVEDGSSSSANMWYFPHECVDVDRVD